MVLFCIINYVTSPPLLLYNIKKTFNTLRYISIKSDVKNCRQYSLFFQESVLALQALTEYAFRARLLDITDMSVSLELPSGGDRHEIRVMGNDSEANHFSFDVSYLALLLPALV